MQTTHIETDIRLVKNKKMQTGHNRLETYRLK